MAQVTEENRDDALNETGANQSLLARNEGERTPWVENSGVLSSQELGREPLGKP